MKRFFLLLLALLSLTLPAMAAEYVADEAGLLSMVEEAALRSEIEEIREETGLDVAILLKNSYSGSSILRYAADCYEARGYGEDGLLFLLTMEERDFATVTSGRAIGIFSDALLDQIHDEITPSLSSGDYYAAMRRYLQNIRAYAAPGTNTQAYAAPGESGDVYVSAPHQLSAWERMLDIAPIILIAALVIALIVVLIFKAQMKTVRRQAGAASYVKDGSFQLNRVQDIYLYTTTHRRKIETNTNSGGHSGGSSTFHSSSGRSYGGRSGKF